MENDFVQIQWPTDSTFIVDQGSQEERNHVVVKCPETNGLLELRCIDGRITALKLLEGLVLEGTGKLAIVFGEKPQDLRVYYRDYDREPESDWLVYCL